MSDSACEVTGQRGYWDTVGIRQARECGGAERPD